ncbi:MAG: acyltransferase, partial [Cyclobacteriaceae bacterium]|nr:acyltransferase [Cyclobacteriaceae bacterium]
MQILLNIKNNFSTVLSSKKDQSVESLRGIALILMVIGHVIGQNEFEGMRLPDNSFYHYLYYSLMYIRMPLFTAIAGYVYSLRPVNDGSGIIGFMKAKFRRILLPLIFVSTIHFLFQTFVPAVNSSREMKDLLYIFIYPYAHFWYLQALFIVFLVISIIDSLGILNSIWKWILLLLFFFLLHSTIQFPSFFSLNQAFYLLPFFILGCVIKRFEIKIFQHNLTIYSIAFLFIIGIIIQQYAWFNNIDYFRDRNNLVGMLIGVFGLLLLFKFRFYSPFLSIIGYYSYGIYLFHVFGTSSSRILLETLNI